MGINKRKEGRNKGRGVAKRFGKTSDKASRVAKRLANFRVSQQAKTGRGRKKKAAQGKTVGKVRRGEARKRKAESKRNCPMREVVVPVRRKMLAPSANKMTPALRKSREE